MHIILDIVTVIFSIFALWWGALWLVESASAIAEKLGISEIIIGLTIVAFGTSAPEFAVTTLAAIREQADISVGNIVGSNIFNLGFILGGVAIISAVNTSKRLVYRDGLILFLSSLILLFFLSDLVLSRFEGVTLFIMLIAYLIYLSIKKEPIDEDVPSAEFHWFSIPKLAIGLVAIIGGGYFLVEASSSVARAAGLSEWVIGVTIVAAGTSAPEFATSLAAVLKGKHGISAGNLVGSNIFNTLGVLGLAAFIHPMSVDHDAFISIVTLTGLVVIVLIFMRIGWRVSRTEGIFLVLINLIVYFFNIFKF
jgi:cation:H+ antiporter